MTAITATSSILARNKQVGLTGGGESKISPLPTQEIINPFLPVNPHNLVCLLFWMHDKRGLLQPGSFRRFVAEANKLIVEIGPERAAQAVITAGCLAKHSFSFKFVRAILERG